MENIKLAISPCPNDTYIFGPWIKNVSSIGMEDFLPVLASYFDIQELNNRSYLSDFDVIKVSAAHVLNILDNYQILTVGAALGDNVGPLLISNKYLSEEEIQEASIAHPGKNTTAFQLLQFAYPNQKHCKEVIFSDIENVILSGKYDAGVIIHENRFTYESKGLNLIKDLGAHWQQITKSPIPLGLIMIKRNLPEDLKQFVKRNIRNSLIYSRKNPTKILPFVRSHAQEMDEKVMLAHIELYVNDFSMDLGPNGMEACIKFFKILKENYHFHPGDFI